MASVLTYQGSGLIWWNKSHGELSRFIIIVIAFKVFLEGMLNWISQVVGWGKTEGGSKRSSARRLQELLVIIDHRHHDQRHHHHDHRHQHHHRHLHHHCHQHHHRHQQHQHQHHHDHHVNLPGECDQSRRMPKTMELWKRKSRGAKSCEIYFVGGL